MRDDRQGGTWYESLESAVRGNSHAAFGEGPTEKGWAPQYLACGLLYSEGGRWREHHRVLLRCPLRSVPHELVWDLWNRLSCFPITMFRVVPGVAAIRTRHLGRDFCRGSPEEKTSCGLLKQVREWDAAPYVRNERAAIIANNLR